MHIIFFLSGKSLPRKTFLPLISLLGDFVR